MNKIGYVIISDLTSENVKNNINSLMIPKIFLPMLKRVQMMSN